MIQGKLMEESMLPPDSQKGSELGELHSAPFNNFQWAVIRLATLQVRKGEAGKMIFSSVTLLSPERTAPTKMEGANSIKLGKSGATVFFRRTVLKAQEAVEWYRSLGRGNSKSPNPSRTEDVWKHDDCDIKVSKLVDDPTWPNLGLPLGEGFLTQPSARSNPTPFIGSVPARVHRRFGSSEGFNSLLANEDALAFLARRLHFNLKEYPEYFGSVALIVPDPIIKKIDNFLIPAEGELGERIFYRFVSRVGQTLDGLKLTTFDEQAFLLTAFETLDVPQDGILEVEKGSCMGKYGYVVHHPIHGILAYHPPCGFMRQMSLNIGVVNETRKVSVPSGESSKSPQTEYQVDRVQREVSNVIGDEDIPSNVNERIGLAARQREKYAFAAKYDQRWFGDGSREEAMSFVRSRVSRARSRVIVADPYFGVLQIPQYLLAITSDSVQIKVLTSRLAFEGGQTTERVNDKHSTSQDPSVQLEKFDAEVKRIKDMGNCDFEVMVLLGKSPALHDRFLVVDDDVWFVGNSLNTLGSRASMIIKLPNPDEVLLELGKMLADASSFNEFYQERKKVFKQAKK